VVDENLTDEQQAELVKNWWRENGLYIAGGLILGIGGLFGWEAWQQSKAITAGEASIAFEEMAIAINQDRYNKAEEVHDLLTTEYASTPYADNAELALAMTRMQQNDAEGAIEVLQRLIDGGSDEALRKLAKLRLGRVQLHNGNLEAAADEAAYSGDDAFAPLFADLRGDIAYARGDLEGARIEYQTALEAAGPGFPQAGYVQVKLDSIAVSEPVAAAEPAVVE